MQHINSKLSKGQLLERVKIGFNAKSIVFKKQLEASTKVQDYPLFLKELIQKLTFEGRLCGLRRIRVDRLQSEFLRAYSKYYMSRLLKLTDKLKSLLVGSLNGWVEVSVKSGEESVSYYVFPYTRHGDRTHDPTTRR